MKTTGTIEDASGLWESPNFGATNSSGFSGLPGGRGLGPGVFIATGVDGYWWSASEFDGIYAWNRSIEYYFGTVFRNYDGVKQGCLSVRCVHD
jgi:uncharacterized protein (TIGR02145 family)